MAERNRRPEKQRLTHCPPGKYADDRIVSGFSVFGAQDQEILFDSEQDREHYQTLSSVLETKLKEIPTVEKVKILAAIYKSLNRHTRGSREYLNFIQQFF